MALRSELHRLGLRFRVHRRPVPEFRATADIVFGPARVAVFVDGCFWHRCPLHAIPPKANSAWWAEKLQANVQRDRNTDTKLKEEGWLVVRVWEHESPEVAAAAILRVVSKRRSTATMEGARTDDRGRGARTGRAE
jgi:DNA mismatch endonuclease (patch repair protein)